MLELQKEFILGFLARFFTDVHLPLISVSNPREQDNEIPSDFMIVNFDGEIKEDKTLSLYIESYSNTEFVFEEPVYSFLMQVSGLLVDLRSIPPMHRSSDEEEEPDWRTFWHVYLVDLMIELFNGFVLGNLISVSAMTRTLIESYAYINIFDRNSGKGLVHRWLASGTFPIVQEAAEKDEGRGVSILKEYCDAVGLSYEDIEEKRKKHNDHAWLSPLMGKGKISFHRICDYVGDAFLHEDYSRACSYIHGQDISTKLSPFAFYVVIYGKLYLMMDYIFKVIRLLVPDEHVLLERVDELNLELVELGKEYGIG